MEIKVPKGCKALELEARLHESMQCSNERSTQPWWPVKEQTWEAVDIINFNIKHHSFCVRQLDRVASGLKA